MYYMVLRFCVLVIQEEAGLPENSWLRGYFWSTTFVSVVLGVIVLHYSSPLYFVFAVVLKSNWVISWAKFGGGIKWE